MPCEYETKIFKPCRCACKWRCRCLIPREKKAHPPFNKSTKRDAKAGLHPKLRSDPPDSPAVGSYNLPSFKSKCTVPCWTREKEVEEFSATMGRSILEAETLNKFSVKTGCGPGTHEIPRWPENISQLRATGICKDVSFGRTPRLINECKSKTPGPGYTFKIKDLDKEKRFSCVPSFEFGGLVPRFLETQRNWSLPCNMYNVKHPGVLETFLRKVTSRRGPYDLFTGPRDISTIKGYMARSSATENVEWPILLPSEIDKLLHKSTYFKGRWTTCPRFLKKPVIRMLLNDISTCYKDPNEPGPGYYEPRSPKTSRIGRVYPFDSSVEYVRPLPPDEIRPGPGTYSIRDVKRIKGSGWTWVFKSKIPRTTALNPPEPYNSF